MRSFFEGKVYGHIMEGRTQRHDNSTLFGFTLCGFKSVILDADSLINSNQAENFVQNL